MKRYVVTKDNGIVDTDVRIHPHVEGFHVKDNILVEEYIDGREYEYSEVITSSDSLEGLKDYEWQ